MIAKSAILFILMIVLPDVWMWWRHPKRLLSRIVHTALTVGMLAYTVYMIVQPDFAPHEQAELNVYLLLLGLLFVPRFAFCLCSAVGWLVCKWRHGRKNYGRLVGLFLVLAIWYVLIYGLLVDSRKVEVHEVEFASADLPAAFDGYRIVQFSDAHVGSYEGSSQKLLRQAVATINSLQPDMIVFTGDIQNMHPQEIYPHRDILSELRANDGVFSVLGNHDYAAYVKCDDVTKVANCRETQSLERQMGWTLLMNEHRSIVRDHDSIIIAGMENWGIVERMPRRGDVDKSLAGTRPTDFIIMLQHDPTAWRHKILPESHAQLTLSGHTHGGQLKLFGWSPASLVYKEWGGMTYEGARALFVSTGLRGFVPFRFGIPGEIVVITLKKK